MRFRAPAGLLLLVTALACAVLAAPAAARVTTYEGQFQCDDRGSVTPLAGMAVELVGRGSPDFLPVEWVGYRTEQEFTDADGHFSLKTHDNDDNYFVRMALRDAHGVHLRDFWGINDWSVDSEQKRNNVDTQNYGGILFTTPGQSHKCALWSSIHKANETLLAETGTELPTHGVEIEADAVTAGGPFTPGTSILWPPGFEVGYNGAGDDAVARHEYGHVIRHSLDGDFGHFLGDSAAFNYPQNHVPCNHNNGGYAFNEGWAEFWAEDFWPAPDCGRPGDMETEGNVAAALQELMDNCAGGQRKLMVETLRNNPLTIHSFSEFRDKLGCPIPRLIPVVVVAAELFRPKPITLTQDQQAAIAKGEVSATRKRIAGLSKSLDRALAKAEDPPSCKPKTCRAALKTATRPAVLQFELDEAKLHLHRVDDYDTAKEQTKLLGLGTKRLVEGEQARDVKDRKAAINAALKGVISASRELRPYTKEPDSGAKGILIGLNKAARKFRKALKAGGTVLPDALVTSPFLAKPPRHVPVVPSFAAPKPPPVAGLRSISTATISCPSNVVTPKPIDVSGTLIPAVAGSAVTVSFRFGNGTPVAQSVQTDAAGNWTASFTPGPNDLGVWTATASFGGDSTRTASASPGCETKYS